MKINEKQSLVGKVSNNGRYKYPVLTPEQKTQIQALMESYKTQSSAGLFEYNYNAIRNHYANSKCWDPVSLKFKLCCNTFIELIWMGRSIDDFVGKTGKTYSNKITKAFDWGYYFDFNRRKRISGIARREDASDPTLITAYYGMTFPNGNEKDEEARYKFSYSTNSHWDELSPNLYRQWFDSFMTATSCAKELYEKGCEIPFEELDVGDLIFTTRKSLTVSETYNYGMDLGWRNITHVSIIYDKKEDGTFVIYEAGDRVDNHPLNPCYQVGAYDSSVLRAEELLQNVVMCARHPVAWGLNNMQDVKQIDYMLMAYQDGLSNNPIPVNVDEKGNMTSTTVARGKYYICNNKVGIAKADGTATSFNETYFNDIV